MQNEIEIKILNGKIYHIWNGRNYVPKNTICSARLHRKIILIQKFHDVNH